MLAMFAAFATKYYQLKADTSSAQSFTVLKNFFTYVDDLHYNVFNKDFEKAEFKEKVEEITGLKISDKESEYLFRMVDVNRNGNFYNFIYFFIFLFNDERKLIY